MAEKDKKKPKTEAKKAAQPARAEDASDAQLDKVSGGHHHVDERELERLRILEREREERERHHRR